MKFIATKFSARCQHKEEIVTTKKLLSRQMKHEEGINSIPIRDLLSRPEVKEQHKKNTTTNKFMLQHNEKHNVESLLLQNLLLSRH